jgi:hypothetical protein
MRTFLFSAIYDGVEKRRLTYLENVLSTFSEPVRFVGFNIRGKGDAAFDVVNVDAQPIPSLEDPKTHLHEMLQSLVPDESDALLEQVVGEFAARINNPDRQLARLAHTISSFLKSLDEYKPDYIYLWNQFNAFHTIVSAILNRRQIPHGFFHDGLLPGSISLDIGGEMGESWVARHSDVFSSIPVTEEELRSATQYYHKLTEEGLSRHAQTESISVSRSLKQAGLNDRPLIFYAGQNDWHAGIKPSGLARRESHSPHFKGSLEALPTLDAMAGELNAAVVFKPHPLHRDKYAFLQAHRYKNSLILNSTSFDVCIKQASVVATIASQACYAGLFAGKPVVMLGINQLRGKGLTYDLTGGSGMVNVFTRALRDPLRKKRERDLIRHIAQLQKVYLFGNGRMHGDFFSRDAAAAGRFMLLCASRSEADVIDELVAMAHKGSQI